MLGFAKPATLGLMVAIVALAASVDARREAHAQYYSPFPWCAQWGGKRGGANECSYYSFDQCLASIFGAGGHCYPNPAYAGPPDGVPRRVKKRR